MDYKTLEINLRFHFNAYIFLPILKGVTNFYFFRKDKPYKTIITRLICIIHIFANFANSFKHNFRKYKYLQLRNSSLNILEKNTKFVLHCESKTGLSQKLKNLVTPCWFSLLMNIIWSKMASRILFILLPLFINLLRIYCQIGKLKHQQYKP